ncbi:SpaA isopeptide-forming pilin-related protein [Streptomyces melanogenes]|uniref:SpaA isopeptide-forming pilin-related protein n=1 Tax=Streptomyces melanogenes TaxID=67326 RepID=UPI003795A3F9
MEHPPRPPSGRIRYWAAGGAALMLAAPLLAATTAAHGPSARADGTVDVTVVRDVDSDGSWTPALEVGERGIPVTITDAAGTARTAVTADDGKVRFAPSALGLTGGRYRVEAVIPPDKRFLRPAQAGGPAPSLSSLVEFVDVTGEKNASVVTGVHVPADYCQANPTLATPCSHQSAPGAVGTKALVSWPYDRTGDGPAPADEATFEQIGATYGLAHKRDTDQLFVGALTKRLMPYGPAGPGGIYVVDRKTKQTSLFATVPDAGDAKHSADLTRDTLEINDAVGKEALGDLDLADDGHTLYAVGLKAKSLYVYDTTGAGPGRPAARPRQTLAIPDPGCPSGADDWRPYGLGFHDGALYVGGTCSAESSQRDADLRAYVLKLSGTSFSTVVSHDLAFERGMGYASVKGDTHWRHWLKTWDPYAWFQQANFPQPLLSDIVFDRDGSMILGFRDRLGDQAGYQALPPEGVTNDTAQRSLFPAMGDVTRVCRKGAEWVWDSTSADCPNHFVNGSAPPQQDGVKEYYYGDSTLGQLAESLQGGLAFAPRFTKTVATIVDPLDIFTGGVRKLDNTTGAGSDDYEVDGGTGSFGKANGLGDLELLCDEAPVQIGNRVWFDRDRDGIQGPTEEPIPGATVTLLDKDGNVVDRTRTDERGEYYFQVKPHTEYQIRFDVTTADTGGIPEKPAPRDLVPTAKDQGHNRSIDSDPDPRTQTDRLTTGAAGDNDHTHDAGYYIPPRGQVSVVKHDAGTGRPLPGAVFQLWRETNGHDGLQTTGDGPDTRQGAACTTGADGMCTVTDLPLGSYYWQETKAPDGHVLPVPGVFGPLHLTAADAGKGVAITVDNHPVQGRIKVLKRDGTSREPLRGAVFELWQETNGTGGLQTGGATPDTKHGAACATDGQGHCTFTGLPLGVYYLRETAVPEGYRLPGQPVTGPYTVTAANAEQGIEVSLVNQRGEPDKGKGKGGKGGPR